ncbi:MAG: hypothetical protein ACRELF_20485 [Gemmataceae bacterium]
MSTITLETMQQDPLVMSVARALTLANETARRYAMELAHSVVTISEETTPEGRLWRIHYGPQDYIARRGGDLTVFVDGSGDAVKRILSGQ